MGITREINKKTGSIIYDVRRTGGRSRYDAVTYIARNEQGERVEIPSTDYCGKYLPAYKIGDVIDSRPDWSRVIVGLTQKSRNVVVIEIKLTQLKDAGVRRAGDWEIYTDECDGRITN